MKFSTIIISFIAIFFVLMCIVSIICAPTSDDLKKFNNIESKEIILSIPEKYNIKPLNKKDYYYRFVDGSDNYIYIICEKNKYIYNGISTLSAEDACDILDMAFFSSDKSYCTKNYDIYYTDCCRTKINGVAAYNLKGKYYTEETVDNELRTIRKAFSSYILATEETLYIFLFENGGGIFRNSDDANNIMSTVYIFGTHFEDSEAPLLKKSFFTKSFSVLASDSSRMFFSVSHSPSERVLIGFGALLLSPIVVVKVLRNKGHLYIPPDSPIRKFKIFRKKDE
jgi:hypothetical protein